ncbi:hypothetical protein [Microbacterium sp. ZW T5_56]|uniref:hypothetical protein n=1 Tax=Microbacterium sp. ZW T5_56 TaxID=3378081 RepID=UPI003852C53E
MNVYLNVFLRGVFAWMLAVIDGGVLYASLSDAGPSGPEGVETMALGMYGMLAFGTFPSFFAVLAALCAPRVLPVQVLAVAIVGFGAWFPWGWMVIHRTGEMSVTMGGLLGGVHVAFFAAALLTRRELWVWRGRARHPERATPDIR